MKKNLLQNNDKFLKGLENIAKSSIEDDEFILTKWWSNKYKLPLNDPRLLNMYFEELYIEFVQDELLAKSTKLKTKINENNWEKTVTKEHDKFIQTKLKAMGVKQFDLSKWQKKAKLIEENNINDSDGIDDIQEIDEHF